MLNVGPYVYSNGDFKLTIPSTHFKFGEIHLVLGNNSSGKTLLLDLLSGYQKGLVSDEISKLAYVSSDYPFTEMGTIKQLVHMLSQLNKNFDFELFQEMINKFLKYQEVKNTDDLSLGQKKLLQLAVALAHHPKVLLLDDISNGLDQKHKLYLYEILQDLSLNQNVCIIIASNLFEDFIQIADQYLMIQSQILTTLGNGDHIVDTYFLWEGLLEDFNTIPKNLVYTYNSRRDHISALVNPSIKDSFQANIVDVLLLLGRGQ